MYPAYKEVPQHLLTRLMEDPMNPAWVDGLLFGDGTGWSPEASAGPPVDPARFTRPELVAPSPTFDGVDLGKLPDWDTERALHYLLGAVDAARDPAPVIEAFLDASPDDVDEAQLEPFGPLRPPMRQHRSLLNGHEVIGFDSDIVCYGIVGHRTAADLAAHWRRIETMLDAHPAHLDAMLALAGDFVRYYGGCAARGSADLYLVW